MATNSIRAKEDATVLNESRGLIVAMRTNAITAWQQDGQHGGPGPFGLRSSVAAALRQASLLEIRHAMIVENDQNFGKKQYFAREWAATSGLGKVFSRGIFASDECDSRGRRIKLDLNELPDGTNCTLLTFVPKAIVEGPEEVIIMPDMETLRISTKAPERSKWCELNEDGTFEEVDRAVMDGLRKNYPERAAMAWISEVASVGPVVVYGDADKQAVTLGYYPPDFCARLVLVVTEPSSTQVGRFLREDFLPGLQLRNGY